MRARKLLFLFVACVFSLIATAQKTVWTDAGDRAIDAVRRTNPGMPLRFRLVSFDKAEASRLQQQAGRLNPAARTAPGAASFPLPLPDGRMISTLLVDAPVLSPELQLSRPDLHTYQLLNSMDNTIAARLTISGNGVAGIIFTETGTAYISPAGPGFPDLHIVYYLRDLPAHLPISCNVKDDLSGLRPMAPQAGDGKKRTFKLAIAATGEYTAWAGSQSNALTYITTTVNDITAIYERDATVSFTLVSNNSIIYTDATTDPYATVSFPTSTTLNSNQTTLNSNIGSANYDLGMVFNNGWNGGLASVGVVCNNTFKGQGAAGLNFGVGANPAAGPQGPIFAGTVAHEIGHQFSATHSFAASNGGCSGNTTVATSYEPGGGSTLMAYAGTCSGNSYQNNTDLYFHAGNIAQIQSYLSTGATCEIPVTLSNRPPTIMVPGTSYTIPVSTPFMLKSTGTDLDGNTLLYTWEQMDPAAAATTSPPQATATSGPNFRSYPPASKNNNRTFPTIDDIIAGNSPVYEVLPSITRTMNFRVTVRDGAAGGGATAEANVSVATNAVAGPFLVTSQSSATSWTANGSNTATITWNVANTTASPVSCPNVDILFSIDGGYTYPYTLLAATPNDGTQTITIPSLNTSIGRIKIQASNNIFFNINGGDITITSACTAEGTTFTPSTGVSAPAGSSSLALTLTPVYGSVVTPAGTLASTDPNTNLVLTDSISRAGRAFTNVYTYDSYYFTVNKAGSYTFTVSGASPVIINLYAQTFDPANPTNNFIASNGLYGNVSGSVYLSSNITATLTPGRYYYLNAGTFSATQPTLPANYSVATSGVAGGGLYSGPQNSGGSFNYTYVIVDNATGNIKAIDPGSNLSNSNTYPAGMYSVYGMSYASSISTSVLNTYVGGPFSTLSNDLLYNPGAVCGNLSKNMLAANISAALPVKLLPLTAAKNGNTVVLKWATASEQHNSYFSIERSADGLTFSTSIGRVNGNGNTDSLSHYGFTDRAPVSNWNYYRLKQVDLDGRASYSNTAKINFNVTEAMQSVYPNPVQNTLHLVYDAPVPAAVQWSIINSGGSTVTQGRFQAASGGNPMNVEVASLPGGTYLLKTVSSGTVLIRKFVKK